MISTVDQQLILKMLRRVKIFAWRFFTITPTLDTVVTSSDATVLNLDSRRGVGELALGVRSGTLVTLEFAAHFQLQPARVLAIQEAVHVHHGGHRYHWSRGHEKHTYVERHRRIGLSPRARPRALQMHTLERSPARSLSLTRYAIGQTRLRDKLTNILNDYQTPIASLIRQIVFRSIFTRVV